ncbi:MAG TPA: hypothetical protein DHV29_06685 [Bacteroidales bacterium]|nr:MAG: hypothetical protein A2W94_05360 [Bacteroidetes bacterium GWE2_42_42]HCB62003.1 hypothetical protein [Bacteroidales bacterium]HCY23161.1 hypothetical protein [Bacteroidales bacterium]
MVHFGVVIIIKSAEAVSKRLLLQNNIPSSESDAGAEGYGIVVLKLLRRFHIRQQADDGIL